MKTIAGVVGILLLAMLLVGCQSAAKSIKPGDKVGDTEFINTYEQCQAPNFSDLCGGGDAGFVALVEGRCEIPAEMSKFWISISLQGATQDELEANWKDSKWEMTYDGQPVDLKSFGTFDWETGGMATRSWNVCIANPTTGKHTVIYKIYLAHGERPGNHIEEYSFTVLPPGATPSE